MKWKVESFFLLSDVYVGMDDLFQAKSTLQSILDNVSDEDGQARALKKYEAILALEKERDEGESNESEIIIEE